MGWTLVKLYAACMGSKHARETSYFTLWIVTLNEARCEKTGLLGFRPGPTQTRLYNHTRWLEA